MKKYEEPVLKIILCEYIDIISCSINKFHRIDFGDDVGFGTEIWDE